MRNFNFNCPHCGSGLVGNDACIGQIADCPNCRKEVMILPPPIPPGRKKPLLAEKEAWLRDVPPERPDAHVDRCPYCGESIVRAAVKCPHCQSDIFRCPQCGARGMMEYHMSAASHARATTGCIIGTLVGGLFFGLLSAFLYCMGRDDAKPSGYFRCKCCGHIIR